MTTQNNLYKALLTVISAALASCDNASLPENRKLTQKSSTEDTENKRKKRSLTSQDNTKHNTNSDTKEGMIASTKDDIKEEMIAATKDKIFELGLMANKLIFKGVEEQLKDITSKDSENES